VANPANCDTATVTIVVTGAGAVVIVPTSVPTVDATENPNVMIAIFDPAISKIGFLSVGQLGLQNEQIT